MEIGAVYALLLLSSSAFFLYVFWLSTVCLLRLMLSDRSQLHYTSCTFFMPMGDSRDSTWLSVCACDRHGKHSKHLKWIIIRHYDYNITRLESPIPSAILEKVHSRNRNAWRIRHGESGVGGGPLPSDVRIESSFQLTQSRRRGNCGRSKITKSLIQGGVNCAPSCRIQYIVHPLWYFV